MASHTNNATASALLPGNDLSTGQQGDTAVSARLAMCSALWGRTNIGSRAADLLDALSSAPGLTARPVSCLIGVNVGGPDILKVAVDRGFTLFEVDRVLHDYLQGHGIADGGHSVLMRWPAPQALGTGQYQCIATLWGFAATRDTRGFAAEVSGALGPGGRLCIDELWSTGGDEDGVLGQTLALWQGDLVFKDRSAVIDLLSQTLELEDEIDRTVALKVNLRDALLHGEGVRMRLQEMPDALRRTRLPALARELHRAVMLFDALDRGVLTAGRVTFRRAP